HIIMVGPLLDKAELVYLRGPVAAAEELNQEALRLATDLGLPEHLLGSQVLAAWIACTAGDRASAIGQLRVLLAGARDSAAQAAIHYALWQLDPDEGHAEAALALYRELYGRSPHQLYRTRRDELLAARRDLAGHRVS
ncbi:MAG TPA: hypothetical protein VHB98_14105, partial [Chloroflexota bacterium]|nr:hypothetical protein [Chloroflexota bacterium]